ncbi:sensor histidine kinase [Maridesulfovibrio zosterae]|uniref:sensor histidine kinase n=1 Tax=Maridesulfovibrio zosterae TaxID=82171 RepID=UPI000488125A|nr:ATP-binding protein [Maridesulfovibrio zosterae]
MPKLNIRQKIILGIFIFSICFGCIGMLSYMNTLQLERQVLLVERVDDLSNIILEIRRTEKNYLLYHDPDLLEQGFKYLNQADNLLRTLMQEFINKEVKQTGSNLKNNINNYRQLLKNLEINDKESKLSTVNHNSNIREAGQALVEYSKAISSFERKNILNINEKLRSNLAFSMVGIAAVVFILVVFVSSSILKPLSQVQEATKQISLGTFQELPIKNSHDEVQQVFAALNSMVEQLKKRRRQLVQAQKLSSIGTLASGIAHQLNNPLNNISTSCQILMERESNVDELSGKMMKNIMQETLRSRDIVKGLLEFSREREYSPGPIELDNIMQSAMSLVSSQVPSNISLTMEIPEHIIVRVDRRKMQEAFINLLINAIQAIGSAQGSISIAAFQKDENATISVKDTGEGIPPKTLERIFDPFFSTKEVGQGTGLGLYIVYGIIEKHHGHIRVESIQGKGTTFFITIPLEKENNI